MDATTLWLYRAVLVAVGCACLAMAIYALSRAGTSTGVRGLDGFLAWLMGKKTYLVAAGVPIVLVLNMLELLSDTRANMFLMLLGAGGLATLRAGQAKAEKVAGHAAAAAEDAVVAAKVSAVKVEQAVTAVAATVAPRGVEGIALPPLSPLPSLTPAPRVPHERDVS